jgi:hypothetical protein
MSAAPTAAILCPFPVFGADVRLRSLPLILLDRLIRGLIHVGLVLVGLVLIGLIE